MGKVLNCPLKLVQLSALIRDTETNSQRAKDLWRVGSAANRTSTPHHLLLRLSDHNKRRDGKTKNQRSGGLE